MRKTVSVRIDRELYEILKEMKKRNGLSYPAVSRVLARNIKRNMKQNYRKKIKARKNKFRLEFDEPLFELT